MNIGSYLESIRKKINEKYAYKDIVVAVISQTTGISLIRDVVKHKHDTLHIEAHPLVKAEIFLQKEKILKEIKSQGIVYKDIK